MSLKELKDYKAKSFNKILEEFNLKLFRKIKLFGANYCSPLMVKIDFVGFRFILFLITVDKIQELKFH